MELINLWFCFYIIELARDYFLKCFLFGNIYIYIKSYFLKILFLILTHQNNLKTLRIIPQTSKKTL
jgi:hypothetical protein